MNMKTKAGMLMAVMAGGAYLGYNYVKSHPEVAQAMKAKAKCATKKVYDMLDDMDE